MESNHLTSTWHFISKEKAANSASWLPVPVEDDYAIISGSFVPMEVSREGKWGNGVVGEEMGDHLHGVYGKSLEVVLGLVCRGKGVIVWHQETLKKFPGTKQSLPGGSGTAGNLGTITNIEWRL